MTRTSDLRAVALMLLCGACGVCACSGESIRSEEKDFVMGGLKAHGLEMVRHGAAGRVLVQRELRLTEVPGDVVKFLAEIGPDGAVQAASYRREGRAGRRYVELRPAVGAARPGALELVSRGNDEVLPVPAGRVRLVQTHEMQTGSFDVEVDLANASFRVVPVRPLDDAVREEDRRATPFIESTAPVVATWCKQQSAAASVQPSALTAGAQLVAAIKPKLKPELALVAPSALNMMAFGGGADAAAALLTACFRALGHPARLVSGTVDGRPRSWTQVHDGGHFVDVDPLQEPGVRVAQAVGFRDAFFDAPAGPTP